MGNWGRKNGADMYITKKTWTCFPLISKLGQTTLVFAKFFLLFLNSSCWCFSLGYSQLNSLHCPKRLYCTLQDVCLFIARGPGANLWGCLTGAPKQLHEQPVVLLALFWLFSKFRSFDVFHTVVCSSVLRLHHMQPQFPTGMELTNCHSQPASNLKPWFKVGLQTMLCTNYRSGLISEFKTTVAAIVQSHKATT